MSDPLHNAGIDVGGEHYAWTDANIYESFTPGRPYALYTQNEIKGFIRSLGVEPPPGVFASLAVYTIPYRALTAEEKADLLAWLKANRVTACECPGHHMSGLVIHHAVACCDQPDPARCRVLESSVYPPGVPS